MIYKDNSIRIKIDYDYKGEIMNPKKKQIIDAAHRLFIEKGFALTSIQDILDDAGIAKGTFYNYFASKSECLLAILELVNEEVDQERRELARGKAKDDEEVFVKQMVVRMNMNRQRNLLVVFESVSFSDDVDLKAFMKEQHRSELQWIAKRLNELFTPGTKRYALDQAAIFLGMVHHLIHVWMLGTNKEITTDKVVRFALARLKPMVREQIQSKEVFFSEDWFDLFNGRETADMTEMKEQVIVHLEALVKKIGKKENNGTKKFDYIQFLRNELQANNPRLFLLESVLMSLLHVFEQSNYEHEIRHISTMVWDIIEQLEKEQ